MSVAEDIPAGTAEGGVGTAVRHDSAIRHVTGSARFIDDISEPRDLLHGWPVLSTHAHARVTAIDTAAALALPGAVAVLTAADIPGLNDIGPILKDEPLLADGLVEHVGQIVALAVAASRQQARDMAATVAVAYEPLPATLSIDAALAAGSFVCAPQTLKRGDAEAGLAAAPHVFAGEVRMGGQDHFYLEGQIALALPGEDGEMVVHSSTQHPSEVQRGIGHVLGLPASEVVVEVRRMGGAFGGKESQATIIAALAALAARHTRRPVKLRLSRDDDMLATGKRHGFLAQWRAGVGDDGRLLALDVTLAANGGHLADHTPPVVARALCHVDNCYFIPDILGRGYGCKTNTVSNTAFRGFGAPQGMLAIEAAIDDIARTLGRDRDEIRRASLYAGDGARAVTPYGQQVEHNRLADLIDALARDADLTRRQRDIAAFNATHPVLKKGLATMPVKFGVSFNTPMLNQAGALVHVYLDGSVHLNHGGTEMGQGLYTKVAQVAAEAFQIDLGHVRISATRTDKVPNTSPTAASTGSDLNGMAALAACREIRTRMARCVAEEWEVEESEVVFADNRVLAGNRTMTFAEAAQITWRKRVSLSATGFYRTPRLSWDPVTMTGRPFFYYSYGAAASEVVIDTLTGEHRILRTDIIHDCGASLNPAIDRGQIEGAFVQGAGWVTSEELWWDKAGALRTHAPSTYKIPGSRDAPADFRVHLLAGAPNPEATIFRSKAVGEPPLMLAISVWLALRDAVAAAAGTAGTVPLDAPATPERILTAIETMRARGAAA